MTTLQDEKLEASTVWIDAGPPPWQTAIRARRILRACALRRKLARRRRWAFIFRTVSHFLKLRTR